MAQSTEERAGAVLVVEQGISDTTVIDLDSGVVLLGKTPEADVVLDNPYISRRHAEIRKECDNYVIRDLESKNGTFVNNVRLTDEPRVLQTGDRIELAPGQVVLRFESSDGTVTLPAYTGQPAGGLMVDTGAREVHIRGRRIHPPLSRKEFDVLAFLYERHGDACNKDDIAARGWPDREKGDVSDQEIEQCIRRLRLRVEASPSRPEHILTVRGYGYKLSRE